MSTIKGQYFRVKVGNKLLAMAKSCNIHKAANLEESSSKDTTGNDVDNDVVSVSWDGSANGLVPDTSDTAAHDGFSLLDLVGTKVTILYLETTGEKNREEKSAGKSYSGTAIVNDVSLEFPDRANSTYSIQFTGCGALTPAT